MRYIEKQASQPECIMTFVEKQMAARAADPDGSYLVDFGSFTAGRQLRGQLVEEQCGLCAYTGAGIDDDRLPQRQPRHGNPTRDDYWFVPHIEHLKPQVLCRAELLDRNKVPGMDLGEDMDYHNMVAALKVGGSGHEQFGAIDDRRESLRVQPTNPGCDSRFGFDRNGHIYGGDQEADDTIRSLKLNHPTLDGWRLGALDAWLPDDVALSEAELRAVATQVDMPNDSKLVEFCFVIKSYVLSLFSSSE